MNRLALVPGLLAALIAVPRPAPLSAQARADTLVVGLEEVERRITEDHGLLAPGRATVERARAEQSRARHARFLPELSLRNLWGPVPRARAEFNDAGVLMSPDTSTGLGDLSWFTQVDLELVQPLYTFGKIGSRIDAAGHQVEAEAAGLEATAADLLLEARRLYWGAVLAEDLLGVSRSVEEQVAEARDRLEALYEEGSAGQNDLFKFELFEYEVGRRLRELEAERTKAREALRDILGVPDDRPFRVADDALPQPGPALDSLSTYLAMAYANRPVLRRLGAGIAARRALVRGARADGRPSLFLAGGFSLNHAPDRFDSDNPFVYNPTNFARPRVALGLEWNLDFQGNNDREQVARYELRNLEAQDEPLRMRIEQEVRGSWLDVRRARLDVERGRDALEASRNLLRAELQTFDIGLGSIDDVVSAFEANVAMEVRQLESLSTYHTKMAELSRRVGRTLGRE